MSFRQSYVLLVPSALSVGVATLFGACSQHSELERTATSIDPLQTPEGPAPGPNTIRAEPAIAFSPTNPQNIAISTGRGMEVSTDHGNSFTSELYFNGNCSDSSVAFDSQGRLFATWLLANPTCGSQMDVVIQQFGASTGTTTGSQVSVSGSLGFPGVNVDKPWVAADRFTASPYRDRLYVAWVDFTNGDLIRVASSSDQGGHWAYGRATDAPTAADGGVSYQLSLPAEKVVWAPHVAVASNGDVYASYHSQLGFDKYGEPDGISGAAIVLRSQDGGSTFTRVTMPFARGSADAPSNLQVDAPSPRLLPHNTNLLVGNPMAWLLPDPDTSHSTNISVVLSSDLNKSDVLPDGGTIPPDVNVYLSKSTDNGSHFSSSRVDLGPTATQQLFPTAAVDDRLSCMAVMYLDNRAAQPAKSVDGGAGSDYKLDVFVRGSADKGATFGPEITMDDVASFDPDWNAPPFGNAADGGPPPLPWTLRIGEYVGVALARGVAHAVWVGNDSSNEQHIMFNEKRVCTDVAEPPNAGILAAMQQSTNVTSTFAFGTDGALYSRSVSHASGAEVDPGFRTRG